MYMLQITRCYSFLVPAHGMKLPELFVTVCGNFISFPCDDSHYPFNFKPSCT